MKSIEAEELDVKKERIYCETAISGGQVVRLIQFIQFSCRFESDESKRDFVKKKKNKFLFYLLCNGKGIRFEFLFTCVFVCLCACEVKIVQVQFEERAKCTTKRRNKKRNLK